MVELVSLTREGVGPLVQRLIEVEYRAHRQVAGAGGQTPGGARRGDAGRLEDASQVAALAATDPALAQVLTWYFGLGPDGEVVGERSGCDSLLAQIRGDAIEDGKDVDWLTGHDRVG